MLASVALRFAVQCREDALLELNRLSEVLTTPRSWVESLKNTD